MAKETNAGQPPGNAAEDKFFGRMNDPAAAASIKGLCGDEMEFHLVIRDGRIEGRMRAGIGATRRDSGGDNSLQGHC